MSAEVALADTGNWHSFVRQRRNELLLTDENTNKLNQICKTVTKIWSKSKPPYPYTPHDHLHCERVEEKLYQLLKTPDQLTLSVKEGFLLIASAWLHDVGMNPRVLKSNKPIRREKERAKLWEETGQITSERPEKNRGANRKLID